MPHRFVVGDIVTPNNSYDPASMKIHQVGGESRYKQFTLCGYEVTDTWQEAIAWDFDNLSVCQRCDRILMNRARNESIARRREESMGPEEVPGEKRYDSVEHVKNALKQKDRLIDKKEEEILRLRQVNSVERSSRLQAQEKADLSEEENGLLREDKKVLMRQVEERTNELQVLRRQVESLGTTVERFAIEKTQAEAAVREIGDANRDLHAQVRALEQQLPYPPMAVMKMTEDEGVEYELHPVRRFLRNGETGEAVAPELYFDIKKDLRKVSPPDAGGFFRVRIIGDVPGRPTERRREQRRVSVDRRRDG